VQDTERITFGSIEIAREQRRRGDLKPFLADSDSGREKTLKLKPNTPETVLQDVRGEAADTRKGEGQQYGQVALTDEERERIDFSETNVPAARSAKAIAVGKGVDDFTSYFDPTLTVDEHRQVFEDAKREGGGPRGGRSRDSEGNFQERLAEAHNEIKANRLPRAKDSAFSGDTDAQAFVSDETGGVGGFDIGFRAGESGPVGFGADFDRLQDRHEERSERAQTIDERRTAPVTRDPFEWLNAPAEHDFPGIDTVDPSELHAERSADARRADERERAPLTRNKEKWAKNPDTLDFRGVDTPPAFGGGDVPEFMGGDVFDE